MVSIQKNILQQYMNYAIFIPMKLRSFIAIEIPHLIQESIFALTSKIRQEYPKPGIRWVPINNIHLTLKFLGDVPLKNLELLKRSLACEINRLESFSIPFSKTGIFPNINKPRIIWIGFNHLQNMIELRELVEITASKLGFQTEGRPFFPHITLGRFSDNYSVTTIHSILSDLNALDLSFVDPVEINSIKIFKSDLKPKGPEYTIIHSIPFMRNNEEPIKYA